MEEMDLLHFVNQQEMKFSPYVKELIRERANQTTTDHSLKDMLKQILMELSEIKAELRSGVKIPTSITDVTSKIDYQNDVRDLSGLDEF